MAERIEIAENMICPGCGGALEAPGPEACECACSTCSQVLTLTDGILEAGPKADEQLHVWDDFYEGERLAGLIPALEAGFANPRLLEAHYPLVRLLGRDRSPLHSSIELGCGSGSFSLVLKKLGMVEEVTLLDYSLSSLRAAGELFEHFGLGCRLVHASLDAPPFRPGSFDLALSAGVIEHFRTTPQRLGCMEAHFAMAPLAFVQAPVSAPFYWLPRAALTLVKRGWPFGFEKPVGYGELGELASKAGGRALAMDHQYFLSFPLFTRLHRLARPGWYTMPFMNEVALLAERARAEDS